VRTALRYLLPLTVLVAAPVLGIGGRAQAGYVSPGSCVSPTPSTFVTDAGGLGAVNDLGAATGAGTSPSRVEPLDGSKGRSTLPLVLPPAHLGRGASTTGTGSSAPPSNFGPNSLVAVASRPETDPPLLVGGLFLQAVERRPPPFPARLFRPPR
jgi:hypothetical protein